ncbi:MAG: hypothetical protein ACKPKO_63890, partial [Candidatus Fonsibacter sp.]
MENRLRVGRLEIGPPGSPNGRLNIGNKQLLVRVPAAIVVIIDDHNALSDEKNNSYLGVRGKTNKPLKGTGDFFTELRSFSRVIYAFSDCPERLIPDGYKALRGFKAPG